MMAVDENVIARLGPGETAGPFEIRIPREIVFMAEFHRQTTRWERFRLRAHLMGRARRRQVFERLDPWFDRYGWHD
jgi:hypothetical protein